MEGVFLKVLILLAAAVMASTMLRRLRIPPILAYLCVGLIMGPSAFAVVEDLEAIRFLAEFGVVFLLFSLGLEFSLAKMMALRHTVFGLGGLQVLISCIVIFAVALAAGVSIEEAIVIAGALSLSSTAVVSKELSSRRELNKPHGQLSIGILLFQDIAAVLFLILVPAFAGSGQEEIFTSIGITLLKGVGLFALLLACGRWLLPPLFNEVAKTHSEEVFVMTVLLVALLAAALTHHFGLSMALGAFIAGMMLSETNYRHQIEADIRPFRDLLLGLFFISVGMALDINALMANWHWIILCSTGLIIGKTCLIFALTRLNKHSKRDSITTGLYLAQGGEFGFALFALAFKSGTMSESVSGVLVPTIVVSIALTPWLISIAPYVSKKLFGEAKFTPKNDYKTQLNKASESLSDHAILCGFGRVGQSISRFLNKESLPYIAVDIDPVRVNEAGIAGENVHYGDASRLDILKALGLERAKLLVISYKEIDVAKKILHTIRAQGYTIPILVRTSDDSALEELLQSGATEIVPETMEASLMLVSHVLTMMGTPADHVTDHIENARKQRYQILHGYYHGTGSKIIDDKGNALEQLHAVLLTANCFATGKTLGELNLEKAGDPVEVIKHANGQESAPSSATLLQEGDTVILHGSSEQIEKVENLILAG
ncbi:monovalent cation:proton antiporter family protein [Alkalimarinus alittae]|uniref:Monovalent cation:proton antiporter-2 (CPA2) family protein n=1 Tax=Alkalimarinus alittae TaxID=2961619 RepID=A0ABY6N0T4_9ALTE|nr:monovalent cation:proton antiporter family protein [Alkalimarinus alittae]UZE95713.1 monovalent cation:proton antiporter-2 (CPA2) family protein [Alkalimarinus alittae]